jgi:hypothetical protein
MVQYGLYSVSVFETAHITYRTDFTIDHISPFYINHLHLLPKPEYTLFPEAQGKYWVRFEDDTWAGIAGTGSIWYANGFTGGEAFVTPKSLKPLGE